jgi:hypothetical protein
MNSKQGFFVIISDLLFSFIVLALLIYFLVKGSSALSPDYYFPTLMNPG